MSKKPKKRKPSELARLRRELAAMVPGGTKDHPIVVESASVVETRALEPDCIGCGGRVRVADHSVMKHDAISLRAIRVECPQCGVARTLYVHIAPKVVH